MPLGPRSDVRRQRVILSLQNFLNLDLLFVVLLLLNDEGVSAHARRYQLLLLAGGGVQRVLLLSR